MDQAFLVEKGHRLVRLLDRTAATPKAAMWVHHPDTDTWKLWIVPSERVRDKREFYRIVAQAIASEPDALLGLDVSNTEYVREDHPAIRGMNDFMHMPGLGSAYFTGNSLDGYYLPEGVVLRMDIKKNTEPA